MKHKNKSKIYTIFYHGTSQKNWKKIKKEGVLWGYNTHVDPNGKKYRGYRYTYLTPDIDIAKEYGEILLEVNYKPVGVNGQQIDNYCFDYEIPKKDRKQGAYCWQFSVFVPIELKQVNQITKN